MIRNLTFLACLFTLLACSSFGKKTWIKNSDKYAESFTHEYSVLYPELGSSLGYKEYDSKGMNPSIELEEVQLEMTKEWIAKLTKGIKQTNDLNEKVDLEILKESLKEDLDKRRVHKEIHLIPFYEVSHDVYNYLSILINEQSPEVRKKAAVDRFKYYMSEKEKKTIVEASLSITKHYLEKYKKQKKFYPYKGEVKKYLANSSAYVGGVKELLSHSGRDDWKDDFKKFSAEVKAYDLFLKKVILPKARKSPKLPLPMYRLKLAGVGVKTHPKHLIKKGKKEYKRVYKEFKTLAKKIAKNKKLKSSHPAKVIAFLKKKQVSQTKEVSKLYNNASDRLEEIIKKHDLVTLPKKKLKIRFAGDAESKSKPVPHLIPPPLIDNDGIVPEFVVPTSSTGKMPFDDFSYESAATVLTAHEGRPGHDLQYSKIIENPISIIRSRYAANSVNSEGWALYAEDLVFPYLTDEEKLVAYQTRLWRIARYFLDPQVQMGKVKSKDVIRVFTKELGVSPTMAGLEYQRYAFRSPGQATAYFHGLVNIQNLKADLTKEFGELKLKCFNDKLLSYGLLPHRKIFKFKNDFKECAL